jgi:transcriptional regulator with XRE-family HTH domain
LSQQALATSTGIRRSYIGQIERGLRNVSVLALLRLAQALELTAAALLARLDTHAARAPSVPCAPRTATARRAVAGTTEDTPSLTPSDRATLLHLLGATIRQYRQHQGLSQPTLAAKTGLSATYIYQIEQGQRNLSVLSLLRIAEVLGLSVAHLLAPLGTCQRSSPSRPR